MSHRLIIRPEAEADMAEAFDWYEERQSGLGLEFLAEVQAALRAASENPLHHQMLYQDVRRVLIRRFPYEVFFIALADVVEVIGVVHAHRLSRVWERRV